MKNVFLGGFNELPQDSLNTYAKNVVQLMTTDPLFASLSPAVAVLKTVRDAFSAALTNNVTGGQIATIEKNNCRTALLKQMTRVAMMVELLADGNITTILAAGFDLRKAPKSYTSLDAPDVLSVTNESKPGLVTVQLVKVDGAMYYGIEKRIVTPENPDGVWVNGEYSSALKFELDGLTSGKTYQLRFRSLGNKGLVSIWSAIQEVFVS